MNLLFLLATRNVSLRMSLNECNKERIKKEIALP